MKTQNPNENKKIRRNYSNTFQTVHTVGALPTPPLFPWCRGSLNGATLRGSVLGRINEKKSRIVTIVYRSQLDEICLFHIFQTLHFVHF